LVRAPRKSVVVVLTSGWKAAAFDHNLNKMWEVALKPESEIPRHSAMREAAVHVTHHRLREGDKGSVFLVASSHVVSEEDNGGGGGGNDNGDGGVASHSDSVSEEEARDPVDAEVEAHRRAAAAADAGKRRRRDLLADFVAPGEEASASSANGNALHSDFQKASAAVALEYFALDGASGALRWRARGPDAGSVNYSSGYDPEAEVRAAAAAARWKDSSSSSAGNSNNNGDFSSLSAASSLFRPQHDLRLDASAAAAARQASESASGCRAFRESVLDAMPHSWRQRGDSRLRLAHFAHSKRSAAAAAPRLPGVRGSTHRAIDAASAAAVGGRAAGRANAVARAAARVAAAAAASGGRGAGGSKRRWKPRVGGPGALSAADDATAAALAASRGRAGQAARAWAAAHRANSLVSHGREGVDVLHLYSGSRVCAVRLPASTSGTAADVDGDGVLDFVVAVSSSAADSHASSSSSGVPHHEHSRACQGIALAGVPPREPLWNVSICGANGGGGGRGGGSNSDDEGDFSYFFGARGGPRTSAVDAAPPAFLRVRDSRGRLTAAGGLVVFSASNGRVTAARGFDGLRKWSVRSGCSWRPRGASAVVSSSATQHSAPVAPTLVPFPLRTHARPAAVLVAGDRRLALISAERGRVLTSAALPSSVAPLVVPLLAADADGDGLTDAIATTADGVFGYAQVRRPASSPEALLTGVMVAAMAAVYLSAQKFSERSGSRSGSGDVSGGDDDGYEPRPRKGGLRGTERVD